MADEHPALNGVARTALLVAAIRARESTRPDRLFEDPYADVLAGQIGRDFLEAALATSGEQSTVQIVVRTRFWDEALLRATRSVRQVVVIAAEMDARAFRLDWPAGTTVFELDQPEVISAKADLLADAAPRCRRVTLGVDLAADWSDALPAAGFDAHAPAVWLMEGLLQYLHETQVRALFKRIDALSAPGSVLLYEVIGTALLESPFMVPVLESMAAQGSPWLFGTDDPGELAGRHGWTASVTDIAEPGNAWRRWFTPAVPLDVPNVPRGYFIEAVKP
ncbi:SAM-dependent methyltransferase [Mycobacterium sp. AMU20-3851]|uniref:SAM-dependent methyltransferase n=1 Tax=Mycobacterium sp. AMU20-3851 TaxID=3122055 RepID=UPI0037544493